MSKMSETETAEILLQMGRKGYLKEATEAQLRQIWVMSLDQNKDQEEFAPDSQMATDEASYRADLFQQVTEMLREQEITTERLEAIAQAGVPWVNPEFVLEHDPM